MNYLKKATQLNFALCGTLILLVIAQTGCQPQYRPANWKDVTDEVGELAKNEAPSENIDALDLERFGELTPWGNATPSQTHGALPQNKNSTIPGRTSNQSSRFSSLPARDRPLKIGTLPAREMPNPESSAKGMTTLPSTRNTTLPRRATSNRIPNQKFRSPVGPGTTLPSRSNRN